MTILIPVVGILCTTLALLLWYPKQIKTGRLAAHYSSRHSCNQNMFLDFTHLLNCLHAQP